MSAVSVTASVDTAAPNASVWGVLDKFQRKGEYSLGLHVACYECPAHQHPRTRSATPPSAIASMSSSSSSYTTSSP